MAGPYGHWSVGASPVQPTAMEMCRLSLNAFGPFIVGREEVDLMFVEPLTAYTVWVKNGKLSKDNVTTLGYGRYVVFFNIIKETGRKPMRIGK